MPEKQLENLEEMNKYNVEEFLMHTLVEEIRRIRARLGNRYTKREEKLELARVLAKNLATLQRHLENM